MLLMEKERKGRKKRLGKPAFSGLTLWEENMAKINDRKRTLIFINLLLTVIASSFLSTALSTALPPIINEFGISASQGQWVTSLYSLVMAIMMPLTAFLLTRYRTKVLYLAAITIQIFGIAICMAAPTFKILLVGRVLQASSNGICTSMAQVVLMSIYPPEKKGTIMGIYGLAIGAAPVIAPTLAGILVDTSGWRMIFTVALVILVASLIFALRVFSNVLDTRHQKFDVLSFVLSGFAFGGITLGIGQISSGVLQLKTMIILVIGILAAIAFSWRQFKQEDPFLDLRIFKNQSFAISVISSIFLYFIMMGSTMLIPLQVQSIMERSATSSGLVVLPGALLMAVISPFAGKIFDMFGMRLLAVGGAACLIFSSFGMIFVSVNSPLWIIAVLNIFRCAAIGCMMMPFVTWGLSSLSSTETPHGSALLTSFRTIAGAMGTALFVGIMTAVSFSGPDEFGMSTAYFVMTLSSIALFLIELLFVK